MDASKFVVRRASAGDMKFPTRFAILNGWRPFGPGDLSCAYAFDPSGFFVGELNGEVISHVNAVKYPDHSIHIGCFMVQKEHSGKGYDEQTWESAWKTLNHNCTIGLDSRSHESPMFKSYGFCPVWENSVVLLNFEKIIKNLGNVNLPSGFLLKPIRTTDAEKLFLYDASVFGSPRHALVEKWISIPGSLGWAALDENGDIVGYTVVRPIIVGAGTEFGLSMAPLYANSDQIASALLTVAAETCRANEAIPVTKFLLIHGHGSAYGEHASQLFSKVEGEYSPFATRMYTKGIPKGVQLTKMYGIMHPAFD